MTALQRSMCEAWKARGDAAADRLRHAEQAPALFKMDAVLDDIETVRHAAAAIRWWAA